MARLGLSAPSIWLSICQPERSNGSRRKPPAERCSGASYPRRNAVDLRAGSGRAPLRIFAADSDGNTITLTFFNNPGWAKKQLPLGEARVVVGRLDQWGDEWQIVHPEVMNPSEAVGVAIREPVYPLTEGISNKRMRELALAGLARAPELPEWIEPSLLAQQHWPAWRASLAGRIANPTQQVRASGWHMTKFSPISLPYCCFASTAGDDALCRFRVTAVSRPRSAPLYADRGSSPRQ